MEFQKGLCLNIGLYILLASRIHRVHLSITLH